MTPANQGREAERREHAVHRDRARRNLLTASMILLAVGVAEIDLESFQTPAGTGRIGSPTGLLVLIWLTWAYLFLAFFQWDRIGRNTGFIRVAARENWNARRRRHAVQMRDLHHPTHNRWRGPATESSDSSLLRFVVDRGADTVEIPAAGVLQSVRWSISDLAWVFYSVFIRSRVALHGIGTYVIALAPLLWAAFEITRDAAIQRAFEALGYLCF